jgi:hypothetical protein
MTTENNEKILITREVKRIVIPSVSVASVVSSFLNYPGNRPIPSIIFMRLDIYTMKQDKIQYISPGNTAFTPFTSSSILSSLVYIFSFREIGFERRNPWEKVSWR